ncbi:MAG: bifunctional hydroxymethylpyrimidine kinase/phosphomethylpyrimidine kinase [Oscillospiraceae bacterium]|nr:bifunctional hydroxymethylpyrimidine kinase/phosphomethylpyrimidine kinase [Oscillospiraceae bacterium]
MKTALTIAGSDCSGGAGIQADLKTFAAHGVYGMSAITAVVAENTCRVLQIQPMTPDVISSQITAVFEDIPPDAVKIGMLPDSDAMVAVAQCLRQYRPPCVVIDPVMVSTGGTDLMQQTALDVMRRDIIPLSTVLTPNLPEAETLVGYPLTTPEELREGCRILHSMGAQWVLLKGGHRTGDKTAEDLLFDGRSFFTYTAKRIETNATHGTGCTLSSAIAANLALGQTVPEAVEHAKAYITMAIAHGLSLGKGHGPTHHFYAVYDHGLKAVL